MVKLNYRIGVMRDCITNCAVSWADTPTAAVPRVFVAAAVQMRGVKIQGLASRQIIFCLCGKHQSA